MILTQNHGPIRELRLNRPPVNALTSELLQQLRQAVEAAPKDGVRALVLSGSPGIFSAGVDLRMLVTLDRAGINALWKDLYDTLRALACSIIPVAAAITGHATAGGTVLGLFCDWRIVAQGDWKLGVNEVQVGLALPPVILRALQRLIGAHQAERLATRGPLFGPEEALCIGLVDEIVPPEQVVPRAIAWCQELLALPPQAVAYTRTQARSGLTELFKQDLGAEMEDMRTAWWTDETQAMLRSVVERLTKKPA
jgi:3,2-trans-enoyl-CoA isomerase